MAPGAAEVGVFPIFMVFGRLPEPSGAFWMGPYKKQIALTQVNFLNPEGHKCSHLGRTRPDGFKIWTFTSASRFLLWLGEITHMQDTLPATPARSGDVEFFNLVICCPMLALHVSFDAILVGKSYLDMQKVQKCPGSWSSESENIRKFYGIIIIIWSK